VTPDLSVLRERTYLLTKCCHGGEIFRILLRVSAPELDEAHRKFLGANHAALVGAYCCELSLHALRDRDMSTARRSAAPKRAVRKWGCTDCRVSADDNEDTALSAGPEQSRLSQALLAFDAPSFARMIAQPESVLEDAHSPGCRIMQCGVIVDAHFTGS